MPRPIPKLERQQLARVHNFFEFHLFNTNRQYCTLRKFGAFTLPGMLDNPIARMQTFPPKSSKTAYRHLIGRSTNTTGTNIAYASNYLSRSSCCRPHIHRLAMQIARFLETLPSIRSVTLADDSIIHCSPVVRPCRVTVPLCIEERKHCQKYITKKILRSSSSTWPPRKH